MRDMGFGQFRDLSPDQRVLVLCRALLAIDAVRYVCTKRRRLKRAVGFAPGDSRSLPSVRVWLGICTPRTECAVRHRRATRPRSTPAQNPCRLQRGHNAVSNRTGRMGLKVLPAPQSRGSVWTQPKPGVAPGWDSCPEVWNGKCCSPQKLHIDCAVSIFLHHNTAAFTAVHKVHTCRMDAAVRPVMPGPDPLSRSEGNDTHPFAVSGPSGSQPRPTEPIDGLGSEGRPSSSAYTLPRLASVRVSNNSRAADSPEPERWGSQRVSAGVLAPGAVGIPPGSATRQSSDSSLEFNADALADQVGMSTSMSTSEFVTARER